MDRFIMPDVTNDLLNEMVEIIVREVSPEKVVLFGSRSRGTADMDSDLDLLVIESLPFSPQRERRNEMTRLWRALAHIPISKDILVYSHAEIERWQNSLNHIVGRALREGKILYEKPC